MAAMDTNGLNRLISIAAMALIGTLGPAWAATGTISANPNPCEIAPGAHDCTTFVAWSTRGVQHARVYVQAEGKKPSPEREFGAETACANCKANWIEAESRYIFTLVDFSAGRRGEVLATVTVTARGGPAAEAGRMSGVIKATPNPCRIPPGKVDCTSILTWSTEGAEHARVYVSVEGGKPSPEREFGTGRTCEKCTASWIAAGDRYIFTLYDWTTGSRGRSLASVVVTAVK